jgi:CheY-like chemotaxis protein
MRTAMVIDDEASIRQVVTLMLESIGWEALGVADGNEALRKLETNQTDLILTDLIMPGMDGMEMLIKIRKAHPEIPTIVMSGDPVGSRFLKSAEVFGAGATIAKPFTLSELETAIRMVTRADNDV